MTSTEREFVHDYLSTACGHAQEPGQELLHERCRLVCKFCESPCRCACHQTGNMDW
jgi:hypothetical protein